MSELSNGHNVFSLLEVTRSIQKTLSTRYTSAFWIKAEMNKLNYYSHSGHCYPELVEKTDGKVIAQMKSILWKSDYQKINSRFIQVLKEPLKDGIKILFKAKITFDSVHGISLQILDIDPSYTLGDLEKEKLETIARLQSEGLFKRNKMLTLPVLPQRIAIVSVETSKGYADFLQVLESNTWNYSFFHMLFPALLQGEKAIESIIHQLRQIEKVKSHFDVVAIIRGGGGDVGLSCYNNFELAKYIAQFPLPVLTGIGHATNETVVEMISYLNGITPTKVAEELLQKFHSFAVPVKEAQKTINLKSTNILEDSRSQLQAEAKLFRHVAESVLEQNKNQIRQEAFSLSHKSSFLFQQQKDAICYATLFMSGNTNMYLKAQQSAMGSLVGDLYKDVNTRMTQLNVSMDQHIRSVHMIGSNVAKYQKQKLMVLQNELADRIKGVLRDKKVQLEVNERNVLHLSPINILKRGYSITTINGRAIRNFEEVKKGDAIETLLFNGKIESNVVETKKGKEE